MSTVDILLDGVLLTVDSSDPRVPQPQSSLTSAPISGAAILGGLTDAQVKQCALKDVLRIAVDPDVPASNAKLKRMATALGMTTSQIFDAANKV